MIFTEKRVRELAAQEIASYVGEHGSAYKRLATVEDKLAVFAGVANDVAWLRMQNVHLAIKVDTLRRTVDALLLALGKQVVEVEAHYEVRDKA